MSDDVKTGVLVIAAAVELNVTPGGTTVLSAMPDDDREDVDVMMSD